MFTRARLLAVVLAVPLAGCAAVSGFPRPILDARAEDAELAPYVGPGALARYEACADKVACRNLLVDARLRAVDLAFFRFQRRLYGQESRVSLGADVLSLTLGAAASVTSAAPLAAGAGLLTGSRDAYQKQLLSASMPLLFEQMLAKRGEVLLRIRQGEALPVANYSLFQALGDISEYELAGSIPAAAAELSASAGNAARDVQTRLAAQRAAFYAAATQSAVSATAAVTTVTPGAVGPGATTTVTTTPGRAGATTTVTTPAAGTTSSAQPVSVTTTVATAHAPPTTGDTTPVTPPTPTP